MWRVLVFCIILLSKCSAFVIFPKCGISLPKRSGYRPRISSLRPKTRVASSETHAFETNVSRVMDIIINSLYSNKDVFIRELISNAADACDKKRFLSLSNANSGTPLDKLTIKVSVNKDDNLLIIEDNGIGMTKDELIRNLGRIAESGTRRFSESINSTEDTSNLIGQFGVGFYSAFLVADKVEVVTKTKDNGQWRWSAHSGSLDKFDIEPDIAEYTQIPTTGTRIVLHVKSDCDQYLDETSLRALIHKYSEFIPFPIE